MGDDGVDEDVTASEIRRLCQHGPWYDFGVYFIEG